MNSVDKEGKSGRNIIATRSSIKRLENEVKKLKLQFDHLVALRIYKPETIKISDSHALEDLRGIIDIKEKTILQLKLML